MPKRKLKTYQLDLFATQGDPGKPLIPNWQALPAETRRSVTALMVRLMIDHIKGDRPQGQEGACHDA